MVVNKVKEFLNSSFKRKSSRFIFLSFICGHFSFLLLSFPMTKFLFYFAQMPSFLNYIRLHHRADVTMFTLMLCAALALWASRSPHSTFLPCCDPAAGKQCGRLLLAAVYRPALSMQECRGQTSTPPPEEAASALWWPSWFRLRFQIPEDASELQ